MLTHSVLIRRFGIRAILALAALLSALETAWACQATVSPFEVGEIELRNESGARKIVYVENRGPEEITYPFQSPELGRGVANWYAAGAIDRVEIAYAEAFQKDPFIVFDFWVSNLSDVLKGYGAEYLFSNGSNAGRYQFSVLATVKGQARKRFFVGALRPGGEAVFWSPRPPSIKEDSAALSRDLKSCESLRTTPIGCDESQVRANYSSALTYDVMSGCSRHFGFRLGRPAVFYWRGDKLAGVAEISPEALKALKVKMSPKNR